MNTIKTVTLSNDIKSNDIKSNDKKQAVRRKGGSLKTRRRRQFWFRIIVQFVFFLAAPSVYNSSFTAVKNTFTSIGAGKPLEMNAFVIQLLLLLVYTVLIGRFFCGWACSFGAINDWIYHLFRTIFRKAGIKKMPELPDRAISILQWLKYVVLVGILSLCFLGRGNTVSQSSPWIVFSLIRSGNFSSLAGIRIGLILLGLDRKSTRLNSSHPTTSRMPSSA